MSCFNPYNSFGAQRQMPYGSQGATPIFQQQPAAAGMTPAMALPTGMPGGMQFPGPQFTTPVPAAQGPQVPQTVQNPYYLAGKLQSYIGREVRVEFLIGTNGPMVDRTGTLLEVGASFIIIRPIMTDDTQVCDLFSIKFVTVFA